KSNDSPTEFRHEDDRDLSTIVEVLTRFDLMIGKGARPERFSQPNPLRTILLCDVSDHHALICHTPNGSADNPRRAQRGNREAATGSASCWAASAHYVVGVCLADHLEAQSFVQLTSTYVHLEHL